MTVTAVYPITSAEATTAEVPDPTDCQPQQITKITDHTGIGLARLITQYKGKPRMTALLTSYLIEVQAIEDAAFQVIDATIDTATGHALTQWGKIVGQVNPGLSDENYRVLIRARIRVNRSDGRPRDLIEILELVAVSIGETPAEIRFVFGNAAWILYLDSDIGTIDGDLVYELLEDADGAGIYGTFVYGNSARSGLFRWSSAASPTPNPNAQFPNNGFESTVTPGNGGKFSSARGTTT